MNALARIASVIRPTGTPSSPPPPTPPEFPPFAHAPARVPGAHRPRCRLRPFHRTCATYAARATAVRTFAATPDFASMPVVDAETAPTLEWVLTNPPPLHCFDEPPILVEFEDFAHLAGGGH